MWIQALSNKPIDYLKNGILQTVKQGVSWPPNLPKLIELCEFIEDDGSFERFIDRKDPKDAAEYYTRARVGFQCRTQLPEDKAKRLWAETIKKVREGLKSGAIDDVDVNAKQIETPEKMRPNLTKTQRNQQLDRQIDEMIAKGQRLIGPYKQRYIERNGE